MFIPFFVGVALVLMEDFFRKFCSAIPGGPSPGAGQSLLGQRGCPGCGLPESVLPGASELDGLREGGPSHAHLRSSQAYVPVLSSEGSTVASEVKDVVP